MDDLDIPTRSDTYKIALKNLYRQNNKHIWRWYETNKNQFRPIRDACGTMQTMENETTRTYC